MNRLRGNPFAIIVVAVLVGLLLAVLVAEVLGGDAAIVTFIAVLLIGVLAAIRE